MATTEVKNPKVTREQQLKRLFGPASKNVPADSLVYIRKNPKRFVQTITEIYGMGSVLKWMSDKA
jgi:hypothetical protein|tara:strand:- start:436 stop:630 length:195 start_codon:yes stop_codon:yes gene_type:complete